MAWTLLVYKLPPHPTRLRLAVWRRLQSLGVIYLQDGVCILPSRDDLAENLEYVGQHIAEVGGTYHLLTTTSAGNESAKLVERFVELATDRLQPIADRLVSLTARIEEVASTREVQSVEDSLRRERIAILKSKRLNYFGSPTEAEVDAYLVRAHSQLDRLVEGSK